MEGRASLPHRIAFVAMAVPLASLAVACGGAGDGDTGVAPDLPDASETVAPDPGTTDPGTTDPWNDPGEPDAPEEGDETRESGCLDPDLGPLPDPGDPGPSDPGGAETVADGVDPGDAASDPGPPPDAGCLSDEGCAQILGPAPPCQRAACGTDGRCSFVPGENGIPCEDGDPCTLDDLCLAGTCEPVGAMLDCADADPCTDDRCVPGTGCTHTAAQDGTPCDDGNPCTTPDACVSGACLPGTNLCACQEDGDCPDDGDLCNGSLFCDRSVVPYACVVKPGTVIECPDPPGECLAASCDPPTGACGEQPVAEGTPCDDSDPCTIGDCCVEGACLPVEDACQCRSDLDCVPYEDGDRCDGMLVCDTGHLPYSCVEDPTTAIVCRQPDDPCRVSTCVPATGDCAEAAAPDGTPCDDHDPCTGDDRCLSGTCRPGPVPLCSCPSDMVPVEDRFCIDRYEASRPDATASSRGVDSSIAVSRSGALPWFPIASVTEAQLACTAAGKRLCLVTEILQACQGSQGLAYVYGNDYDPATCNGIDTYCDCREYQGTGDTRPPHCWGSATCPYPGCFLFGPDGTYGSGCGGYFTARPTGYMPGCVDEYGAFDITGNVWELVAIPDPLAPGDPSRYTYSFKGGAYNCSDSRTLHRCDGLYTNISAMGFRCCRDLESPGA